MSKNNALSESNDALALLKKKKWLFFCTYGAMLALTSVKAAVEYLFSRFQESHLRTQLLQYYYNLKSSIKMLLIFMHCKVIFLSFL